ncbi:MAG: hypothetical protein LPK19_12715 [Hymenobacteraceae bacterium]|nr:hypothetical protein [Hymenobacteraceae bacterium]MDX5397084.1 hypothetical protein [Hymenobacteraceae bacterium]MDX5513161.1 hypothetical protein [Hymenobacteraceae bacterium]
MRWLMVEVFKTDVQRQPEAEKLVAALQQLLPGSKINFDLEDCDKILRVEADDVRAEKIAEVVQAKGYWCEVLE